jgi:glucan 1,3-beta-glucosidase
MTHVSVNHSHSVLTVLQNGYGIGARYDGTFSRPTYNGGYESSHYIGSCANLNFIDQWTDDLKTATTNYIRAQIDVASNQAAGWIFWNFKTEASAEWDFFRLLDNGIWPS